jgi:hypothetical protein
LKFLPHLSALSGVASKPERNFEIRVAQTLDQLSKLRPDLPASESNARLPE